MNNGGSGFKLILIIAALLAIPFVCTFSTLFTWNNIQAWFTMDDLHRRNLGTDAEKVVGEMGNWLDNHEMETWDEEIRGDCNRTWSELFRGQYCDGITAEGLGVDIDLPEIDARFFSHATPTWVFDWDEFQKYDIPEDYQCFDDYWAPFDMDGDGKRTKNDAGYAKFTAFHGEVDSSYITHKGAYDTTIDFNACSKAQKEGIPGVCGPKEKERCSVSNWNHTMGYGIFNNVAGTVIHNGWYNGWGWAVVIYNQGCMYIYGHLDPYAMKANADKTPPVGETVKPGDVIGFLGGGHHSYDLDGSSTGTHLDHTIYCASKDEPNGEGADPFLSVNPARSPVTKGGTMCDPYKFGMYQTEYEGC